MTRKKTTLLLLLATSSLLFLTAILGEAWAQTAEEISKELICPCGCSKILSECFCDTAAQMRSDIELMIGEGKTKDQIIADLRATYTDQILVTPSKSDLELTLWMFPIFASVIGTIAIYEMARRKAAIPDSEVRAPIAETGEEEKEETSEKEKDEMAKYEDIFEREYQKFKKDQEEESST